MPWKCVKCSYETNQYEGEECPDCGGLMEEADSEIDWLGDKEEKDGSNPDKDQKEKDSDDIAL